MPRPQECLDCGTILQSGSLKAHQQTDKCRRVKELNEKVTFRCRKCGICHEKMWQAEKHSCFGEKVHDPVIEELKLKLKFYSDLVQGLGIHLEVDWDEVKNGTFLLPDLPKVHLRFSDEEETAEDEEDDTEEEVGDEEDKITANKNNMDGNIEPLQPSITEKIQSPPLSPLPLPLPIIFDDIVTEKKKEFQGVMNQIAEGYDAGMMNIKGLVHLLQKKDITSADGENRYYILGNKLGEFVTAEFYRQPEEKILLAFTDILPVTNNIRNTITEREEFLNGIKDSFCPQEIHGYILYHIDMLDSAVIINPKDLLNKKSSTYSLMPVDDVSKLFTFTYALLPIQDFITSQLLDMRTARYASRVNEHRVVEYFFRNAKDVWIPDPYLLNLTHSLSNTVLDLCVKILRRAYKHVYGDNIYRDKWMTHPFMKQFIHTYKNIEITAPIFDLNYILRRELIRVNLPASSAVGVIKVDAKANEEWSLMSTRIHSGIPGYDLVNFYELIFDSGFTEIAEKWTKKYIGGLKTYKAEFQVSQRFKTQVTAEVATYTEYF